MVTGRGLGEEDEAEGLALGEVVDVAVCRVDFGPELVWGGEGFGLEAEGGRC